MNVFILLIATFGFENLVLGNGMDISPKIRMDPEDTSNYYNPEKMVHIKLIVPVQHREVHPSSQFTEEKNRFENQVESIVKVLSIKLSKHPWSRYSQNCGDFHEFSNISSIILCRSKLKKIKSTEGSYYDNLIIATLIVQTDSAQPLLSIDTDRLNTIVWGDNILRTVMPYKYLQIYFAIYTTKSVTWRVQQYELGHELGCDSDYSSLLYDYYIPCADYIYYQPNSLYFNGSSFYDQNHFQPEESYFQTDIIQGESLCPKLESYSYGSKIKYKYKTVYYDDSSGSYNFRPCEFTNNVSQPGFKIEVRGIYNADREIWKILKTSSLFSSCPEFIKFSNQRRKYQHSGRTNTKICQMSKDTVHNGNYWPAMWSNYEGQLGLSYTNTSKKNKEFLVMFSIKSAFSCSFGLQIYTSIPVDSSCESSVDNRPCLSFSCGNHSFVWGLLTKQNIEDQRRKYKLDLTKYNKLYIPPDYKYETNQSYDYLNRLVIPLMLFLGVFTFLAFAWAVTRHIPPRPRRQHIIEGVIYSTNSERNVATITTSEFETPPAYENCVDKLPTYPEAIANLPKLR